MPDATLSGRIAIETMALMSELTLATSGLARSFSGLDCPGFPT
jgi:hypothetical protein